MTTIAADDAAPPLVFPPDSEIFPGGHPAVGVHTQAALAVLLGHKVVVAAERETTLLGGPDGATVTLYVDCDGLFEDGVDAQNLPLREVGRLYLMHRADPRRGALRWACLQRGCRPRPEVRRSWSAAGAWDAELEALPEAPPA